MDKIDDFFEDLNGGLLKAVEQTGEESADSFFYDLGTLLGKSVCCGLEIKNKLCFFNLTDNFLSDGFGNPSKDYFNYYYELAKSGVGTIFTGDFVLGKNVRVNQSNAKAKRVGVCTLQNNKRNLSFFKSLTGAVHSLGSKIFISLKSAFGRGDYNNQFLGMFNVSVSGHRNVFDPAHPCATISDGRVKKIVSEFFDAASAAANMNFDGVLIDGSDFNILGEFSSKIFNRRHYGYFFNQTDFAERVVKNLAKIDGLRIFYKLTAATFLKQFYRGQLKSVASLRRALAHSETLDELVDFISKLSKYGVCGFVLEFGTFETGFLSEFSEFFEENVFLDFFRELKHRLDELELKNKYGEPISLVLCDNYNSPHSMNLAVNAGCGLVPVTKQLLADNDYILKLSDSYDRYLHKKASEREVLSDLKSSIVPCIKCSYCNFCADKFSLTTCSVNPLTFQKGRQLLKNFYDAKGGRVAVVGAGVSGMVAAITLAERGFEVELFDKNSNLNACGRAYEIFGYDSLLKVYNDQLQSRVMELEKTGKIKLQLQREFDAERDLLNAKGTPEYLAVFVATGFHEKYFDAVGAVLANSKSIFEVATDKSCLLGRERFVIYASGELSFKLALYLKKIGKEVSLIIANKGALSAMSNGKITYYANALNAVGVPVFIEAKIKRIEEDFVEIFYSEDDKSPTNVKLLNYSTGALRQKNFRAKSLLMDMFIYEPELYSNNKLFYDIVSLGYSAQVYLIGNALTVSGLWDCVKSAYFAAKNL